MFQNELRQLCRPKDKALDADAHRRKAPVSEADLDNTVRTLTEQRLSDGSTSLVGVMRG